jgi:hypothetical protein
VHIHPGRGEAHFRLRNYPLFDFTDVANAIFRTEPGKIFPARTSLDMRWHGTGERQKVREDTFRGVYENAIGAIDWSASNTNGYFFDTQDSSERHVTHAFTAYIRNGVFSA